MATSVELRRGDYTGGGVYRTANGDTQANLTGIKLQVDSIQEALKKDVFQLSYISSSDPAQQRFNDLGKGSDVFTLKGTISKDSNGVNGVKHMLDLRYAVRVWYQSGICSLVWTDESLTTETMTYTGFPIMATFGYTAGNLDMYSFTIQFAKGVLSSA